MKFHRPLLLAGLASIGSSLFVAHAQNNEAQNKALEALRKVQSGQTAPPVTSPAPAPARPADSAAQEKALRALRDQQSGRPAPGVAAHAKPVAATPTSAPVAQPAPVAASVGQAKALEALRQQQAAKPVAVQNSPAQAKAIEALNNKWSASTEVATSKDGKPVAPVAKVEPVVAKVPVTKAERLADLTRRYKADEVTPHDYHTQRAKILSEP